MTNWVMHEYRLDDNYMAPNIQQDTYYINKLFKKSGVGPKIRDEFGAPYKEEDWKQADVREEGYGFLDDSTEHEQQLMVILETFTDF